MSVCLDRFAQGLPDPQAVEPEPVANCIACGETFYQGDEVMDLTGGDYCCCEASCMAKALGFDRRVL